MISFLVLVAYLSLGVELLFFPVPSVASSYNLWSANPESKEQLENANISISEWPILKKIFFLAFPIAIICITFSLPIIFTTGLINSMDLLIQSSNMFKGLWYVPFIFIFLGRFLSFYSVLNIRKNNRQKQDSFELKNTSIYSKSRNPIQLGMYLFAFGLILLYPAPIFICGIIFYIIYMDYKIRIEEKFLLEKFGSAYSNYASRTKRYF